MLNEGAIFFKEISRYTTKVTKEQGDLRMRKTRYDHCKIKLELLKDILITTNTNNDIHFFITKILYLVQKTITEDKDFVTKIQKS